MDQEQDQAEAHSEDHSEDRGKALGQNGGETAATGHYWRANLKLLAVLLAIWFAVSFGAGVLARDWLDQFMLGGYPLGFWFAQQGSIYVFIVLIFVYAHAMQRLERKHGLDD